MTIEAKLSSKEAAEYLGISVSTLYRMEKNGSIGAVRTPGGQRRFSVIELDQYMGASTSIKAPQKPYKAKPDFSNDSTKVEETAQSLSPEIKSEQEDKTPTGPDPRNQLNDLVGQEWIQETKSVWFQKGLGSNHEHAWFERQHPAPFSFQDVSRLIKFFTKKHQIVLDPFSGVASTLKACALSERYGVGIELSEHWNELGRRRLETEVGVDALESQTLYTGDSRTVLNNFPSDHFHFVVTSPPYWNILSKKADHKVKNERIANNLATKYSEDDPNDLGNLKSYEDFLSELGIVFRECRRVLVPGKYMAVVVSDFRHKSSFVPFHADLIRELTVNEQPFELQGIKVLIQNSKKLYPYGYPFSYVENIHHQYILLFRKPKG